MDPSVPGIPRRLQVYRYSAPIKTPLHFPVRKADRTGAGARTHHSAHPFPRRLGLLRGCSDLQGCSQCMEMELGSLKARCPYNSHVKQQGSPSSCAAGPDSVLFQNMRPTVVGPALAVVGGEGHAPVCFHGLCGCKYRMCGCGCGCVCPCTEYALHTPAS